MPTGELRLRVSCHPANRGHEHRLSADTGNSLGLDRSQTMRPVFGIAGATPHD